MNKLSQTDIKEYKNMLDLAGPMFIFDCPVQSSNKKYLNGRKNHRGKKKKTAAQ
jgi:hypothetical protein